MTKRNKYSLSPMASDTYDGDYVGLVSNLISDLNKELTKMFITVEFKIVILERTYGTPYPIFHVVFEKIDEETNKPVIGIEFNKYLNLYKNYEDEPFAIPNLRENIEQSLYEHICKLGYDLENADNFIDKLIENNPKVEKYFIINTTDVK